jgi:hypothetical protein
MFLEEVQAGINQQIAKALKTLQNARLGLAIPGISGGFVNPPGAVSGHFRSTDNT